MPLFSIINTPVEFLQSKSWITNKFFVNFGYIEDGPGTDLKFSNSAMVTTPIEQNPSLKQYFKPISDQYNLSSCVANAVADCFEAQMAHRKGCDPSNIEDISRLFIYWNARNLSNPPTSNIDKGSQIRLAFDSMARYGAPSEKTYPYDLSNVNVRPPIIAYREAIKHRISKFYRIDVGGINRIVQIKQALSAGNPVVFGTKVAESFKYVNSDEVVVNPGGGWIGGHAMCIVGWSEDKQAFEVRNSWGCYDDKTEILTNDGWKLFKDVTYNDKFATLNSDTHHLEFQKASKIHEYDFSGKLYYFKDGHIDLAVTPNHRMYVGDYKDKDDTSWSIKRADEISKPIYFKKDVINIVPDVSHFNIEDKTVEADTWLEFMGYFLSCGYNCEKHNKTTIYETIGLNKDKINHCLKKLPFKFSKDKKSINHKSINRWHYTTKELYKYLSIFGKEDEKFIPRYLLELSRRQSKILLDAMMLGNGTKVKGKYIYHTSSKQLADDIQELALRCNLSADIRITNRVRSKNNKHAEYKIKIKTTKTMSQFNNEPIQKSYTGKVYCVTVPNGLLYVRRNGKAVWCGNSDWGVNGYCWMDKNYIASSITSDIWVPTV